MMQRPRCRRQPVEMGWTCDSPKELFPAFSILAQESRNRVLKGLSNPAPNKDVDSCKSCLQPKRMEDGNQAAKELGHRFQLLLERQA